MTQAFKVGDRVKVTRTSEGGTVAAVRSSGVYYDVIGPGIPACSSVTPGAGTYHADGLEKVEPEPKFKIGDRAIDSFGGGVVTVTGYRAVGPHAGYVRAQFPDGDHGLWRESELTKVEQGVPFFLRNGDIVVNRKTGRKGEVIRGMVYDVKPPASLRDAKQGVPAAAIEEYEDHHPGTYDLIKKDAPW